MKILQRAFAEANSTEQAEMFNEFGRLLYMMCSHKGKMGMDTQLCYVADDLDAHGERMIVALAEFVKLKHDKI